MPPESPPTQQLPAVQTPAQAEAEKAAQTPGVGAGAGGTDVLEQMAEGNLGLFNNGPATSGQ